jgi:pimeloyl-ACP methyl ester carboxylesterase
MLGNGEVGVVLAHMVQSDLCEWLPYAKRLQGMGRRVLIFDFGLELVDDVVGAAAELRREGVAKVVLVGGSMGGTASLVAASITTPLVAGVASLSGPAEFSVMDAMTASKQLTVPVLYMAAENDQERFPNDARAMYAACSARHKQLVILPGSDHGSDLLSGNASDQARSALETFITDSTG